MARQKRVIQVKFFTDGLFFKIVSSLGYFCLNCPEPDRIDREACGEYDKT
jgi:hypothetical protein